MYEIRNFETDLSEIASTSLIIQFSAVTIAVTALLIGIPSVEIITFSTFFAGYIFNLKFASKLTLSIVFSWEVIATMVYGFSGYIFPFKVLAWLIVMLIGRLVRASGTVSSIELGIIGAFSTLIWDVILLFALPITLGTSGNFIPLMVASFIFGIPFTVVHVISNLFLFSMIPSVLRGIKVPIEVSYRYLLIGGSLP